MLYRCRSCHLVHRAQIWTTTEAADHYKNYYAKKLPERDPITERRYEAILERFEALRPPGRLLDVGCGQGHFLLVAESRGWQPVGLEVSASGLGLLERVRAENGSRFELIAEDLLHADLPTGAFAAITLFEVLEHLTDPVPQLERIRELLEPGGLLYLTTPNFDSVPRYALGNAWRVMVPDHVCLYTPRALRRCLARVGFDTKRLLTKNIDLPEIRAKWRLRGHARKVATVQQTNALRHQIEESRALGWMKGAVNTGLRVSGLGETIEALAVRPLAG